MKIAALLLLLAASAAAQSNNVTFSWDSNPAVEQILLYRVHELAGTNVITVGTTTNTSFTVTNYQVTGPRTFGLSASNVFGWSSNSAPVTVPIRSTPPGNVRLTALSVNVPVPGVMEISTDLVDWHQRFRTAPLPDGVGIQIVQYATEPVFFMRPKAYASPPLPIQ